MVLVPKAVVVQEAVTVLVVPVAPVVVAAIAAAGFLIITNWSAVSAFFQQLGMQIMAAFAPALPAVQSFVMSLMQLGMAIWQIISSMAMLAMAWMNGLAGMMGFASAGQMVGAVIMHLVMII
jgi:hypothetical protein